MSPTYRVVRYSADGNGGEFDPGNPHFTDGAMCGDGLTLDEARALCRRLVGGDHGRWLPRDDETEIEAWNESGAEMCGGWIIQEEGRA